MDRQTTDNIPTSDGNGPDRRTDETTAAADMFVELQGAATTVPDYRKAYRKLGRTFRLCLDMKTDLAGIRFSGPFAQTDFLLKEYKAERPLRAAVNGARVRIRRQDMLTDEETADNFMHDFEAVCRFVGLVFRVPVPGHLEARFPEARHYDKELPAAEYLRVVVNRWDDTFIYANADAERADEIKVNYAEPHKNYPYDRTYLRDCMREGCQLNIIRPIERDGALWPELIIVEPDYLVDISAIAKCFEDYSHSSLLYLLNKIKPTSSTSHIILGNLAGQFLDEELCMKPEENTYKNSIVRFFRDNSLGLLTTDVGRDFHAKAQSQKQNIRHALRVTLPQNVRRFRPENVMVEPSFFSEMLGLQGRMDFMQLDRQVLIEQKSGKGGWPPHDDDTPVHQEQHYIQLLLYMLLIRYNYRETYEKNGRNLQAFLLYSKYSNGLISEGFSPGLIAEAIRMRNGIVAAEYGYTPDGIEALRHLTADSLRTNHVNEKFWETYIRPQLDNLLTPIRSASPLEWAYVSRMLTFVRTEHLLSKAGNQTKENSGFADKWQSTLEDKLQAGNIYHDMTLAWPTADDRGKVERAVLRFGQKMDDDISNFRTGDIVIIYPYDRGKEPDARRTMVFRGTIESICDDIVIIGLRNAQTDAKVLSHDAARPWAIEHDMMESSFTALYRGTYAFLTAPQERKELLLFDRKPRHDETLKLRGNYGDFNELALRVKQAQDFFIIIGPPGTGKTSFGLLNTLREELLEPSANVLLLSYTNRAVDEICSKLAGSGIDYIRIGGRYTCEEPYRSNLIEEKTAGCSNITELRNIIDGTRVFVGTTSTFNNNIALFGIKRFSLAIIDEASQILEPHIIGLLCVRTNDGSPAIGRFVLIGDHKQLPAVVQQREDESYVSDDRLRRIHLTDCRLSLFERLLKKYHDDPHVVYMLTRQGRMHHDIALFPNIEFYRGQLQEVPLDHQNTALPTTGDGRHAIDDLLTTRRIAFINMKETEEGPSDKVNTAEAEAIAATVVRIYRLNEETFEPQCTVGVIVPYRNQIGAIRNAIARHGIGCLRGITIDTVERYQGSQRKYIIYGFTVKRHYQLKFLTGNTFTDIDGSTVDRKLNVAMTRAEEHLIMFGNAELLASNFTFMRLTDFARNKHCYFSVGCDDYCKGQFDVRPYVTEP